MRKQFDISSGQNIMNAWNPAMTLGSSMLIVIISYVLTDILINKKQNIVQLFGKLFIVIICMIIIFIRRG